MTTAVNSESDSVRLNEPGDAVCKPTAKTPPPRPAAAELTANASTRNRAAGSPASCAAISPSRAERRCRPTAERCTLARKKSTMIAANRLYQACQWLKEKDEPSD